MLISSFLSSTREQSSEETYFKSQAEGHDSVRQTVLFDYNNKSNERQVKESVTTWGQIWLPPYNKTFS